MAIALATDIVMDVMKAAAPEAVEAARARLAGRAERSLDASFSVDAAATPPAAREDAVRETATKFEAMVLQTFLQTMMPKEAEAVYGSGLSGDMWKSLMAEKIAEAVAERGGIGIAQSLVEAHYLEGERKVPLQGVDTNPHRLDAERHDLLSTALVQEIQRAVMLAPQDEDDAAHRSRTDV